MRWLAISPLLALGLAVPALAQTAVPPRQPALLVHGNYCGPGNNAPLPPIDALDLACAHHDACSPDEGLPSRACNLRLAREAGRVAADPRQPEDLRRTAGIVAAFANLMPSDPGPGLAAPGVAAAPTFPRAGAATVIHRHPDPFPIEGDGEEE
ncbi:hypothetical protein [Methylobacterium sp. JK268]